MGKDQDLSRVDLVDPRTGTVLCAVKPVDKSANATGQRRHRTPASIDLTPLPVNARPALLTAMIRDYAATGLPPAYLPSDDEEAV